MGRRGGGPRYEIEWDPEKARANLARHGVSFEEGAGVFLDPRALTLFDRGHSDNEDRWVTLGEAQTRRLVITSHTFEELGEDRFRIRIISVRKPTRRERRIYQEEP